MLVSTDEVLVSAQVHANIASSALENSNHNYMTSVIDQLEILTVPIPRKVVQGARNENPSMKIL